MVIPSLVEESDSLKTLSQSALLSGECGTILAGM